MSKTKIEAAREQLEALKKAGLRPQDCRTYLERFGLKEMELDELLPGTKTVRSKAKDEQSLKDKHERYVQAAEECSLYLRQLAYHLPRLGFAPRDHIGDVISWAQKLERLKVAE